MASEQPQRILYWGSGSPFSWRVATVLKEKSLPYDSRRVETSTREQMNDELVALNPRGQVPAFADGDAVLNESLAAVIHLEETYPDPPLLPELKTAPRSLAWQRTAEAQGLQDKVSAPFRLKLIAGRNNQPLDEAEFAKKLEELRVELGHWESYLSRTQYVAGPTFTLADVVAGPALLAAQRYGADFVKFPKIAAYVALVAQRPSIKETWPPHWLDTPRQNAYAGL